jgi:hypothetical protein
VLFSSGICSGVTAIECLQLVGVPETKHNVTKTVRCARQFSIRRDHVSADITRALPLYSQKKSACIVGSAPAVELTQAVDLLALVLFEFEYQPLQALASAKFEQRSQDGDTKLLNFAHFVSVVVPVHTQAAINGSNAKKRQMRGNERSAVRCSLAQSNTCASPDALFLQAFPHEDWEDGLQTASIHTLVAAICIVRQDIVEHLDSTLSPILLLTNDHQHQL